VTVDGTLNKRDDKDRGWTVEVALPLEDVKGMDTSAALPRLPPKPGDVWRINMFRLDQPEGKPQEASAWSPPLVGDFHALGRFGELVFGDAQGNVAPVTAMAISAANPAEAAKLSGRLAHPKKKPAKHEGKSAP
jgi:hypothetical protein